MRSEQISPKDECIEVNTDTVYTSQKSRPVLNRRTKTLITLTLSISFLVLVIIASYLISDKGLATNLSVKNMSPTLTHPFGTDWLGRDMLTRTLKGLRISLAIGALATGAALLIALILGLLAATLGKKADAVVTWMIDLFLSLPHIVFLILISVVVGRGMRGVVIGIALTHWASFARVVRAEVMQIKDSEYIQLSRQMGKSSWWIATKHILPHMIPLMFVGFTVTFPHAILHEASVTFLGFGLSPHQPAIGIILSEMMEYMSSGMWWLVLFPGLSLFLVVLSIHKTGDNFRMIVDPHSAHE